MKLNLFSLILSLLVATSAHAERVIVIMKDSQTFQAAHMAYKVKGSGALKTGHAVATPVNAEIEQSLENLNTFIVNANGDAEIAKLQNDPAVAYVEKEVFHPAPAPVSGWLSTPVRNTPTVPGAKTPWGILAVKAPQAWAKSNQGQGARVLVLDTGIDANHPSLKANFEQGKDFTGDSDGSDFSDKVGHGSHCAGTIAGVLDSNGFTGVAPQAKLLAGRVCSTDGCSNAAIAAGINWGISQKVDVISMSLGGIWSTPGERDAIAKAAKAGLTVVAASGNDGKGRVSYPAALPTVIAVGAVDSNLKRAEFSQYGPELAIVAPGVGVLSSVPQGTGRESSVKISVAGKTAPVASTTFQGAREVLKAETNVLVEAGLGKEEDFAGKDFKGKYALIGRGEINFSVKIQNAMKAGAIGAVIYNNAPGLINGALTDDGTVLPVAVFMIEQAVGQKIVASLKTGSEVKATLQTVATDYAEFQGTSMATPHVAGVAALMKAANKNLNGAQVKQLLMATAIPQSPNTNNEYGAGVVDAEAAVTAALSAK